MNARWTTLLTDAMIGERITSGEWDGSTLAGHLERLWSADPGRVAVIDGDRSLSVADCREMALRLLSALQQRGLVPGDVVSFQLPNWHEAIIIELACAYGGFVCNPIVQIYRDAEVQHIVGDARSRVLFVPQSFRRFDYEAMVSRIEDAWSDRPETVLVRPQNESDRTSFEMLLAEAAGPPEIAVVDANDIKLLMYTSGTTGPAKGVLHTHNTIGAEVRNFAGFLGLGADDVVLMPSPLGHITGYLYGIQLPITLGCRVVLMDVWDVGRAADLIDRHGVTFTIGATPFVQELARFAVDHARPMPSLRYFPSGGAPVPPEVVHRANAALPNCTVFRLYGSTEAPTVTLGVPDKARADLGATTEGYVVAHDVRLTDPDGRIVAPGEEGEIRTRGPEVCVGYARFADNAAAFDADGYFLTGDLARMTPEGCLVITGRSKDLIIRGGENISPKEIEDILHAHPAIDVAAVVAMPHHRLGETCCAVVRLKPGADFDFAAMERVLSSSGLARQKFPERLEVVSEMPYTAAGKIRKNLLRDLVRDLIAKEKTSDGNSDEEKDAAG
ncbi:AMP-binding protein [Aquibium sp. LZ166]|uniref:AMP-binding protein n=1 Tax=Aquibium pacificus TaxID=3153579 RepID=A0ABV3SKM6_9HYPH